MTHIYMISLQSLSTIIHSKNISPDISMYISFYGLSRLKNLEYLSSTKIFILSSRKIGVLLRQTLKSWMKMWNMKRESPNLISRMRTRRLSKQKVSKPPL